MIRKELFLIVTALAGLALLCGCKSTLSKKCGKATLSDTSIDIKFPNEYFYGSNGEFDQEKAKDAIIALMKYHRYPVFPNIREQLWVSDYGTGKFTEVGLAACMFKNNSKQRYMLMDLFLLPNQMLPEHWHLEGTQGDDKGNPAKLEGWLVRHGSSYIVGEGKPNLTVNVPNSHNNGIVTVKHEVFTQPGEFVQLNRAKAHHWQLAGPRGAIITEVANVHSNTAVRHLDKSISDYFLGK